MLAQHLALSVAAGLARTQLVPEPLRAYDAQQLAEMLDLVGRSLARVAPLYVQDPQAGTPRELSQEELQGAEVRRGATVLVLKDGRKLSGVSMKRADLRQAVAILKAVGVQDLKPAAAPAPAAPAQRQARFDPLARLAEIERLLRAPIERAQADEANRIAVALARSAAQGRIANLAMQLVSAVHEARAGDSQEPATLRLALARLRTELEKEKAAS